MANLKIKDKIIKLGDRYGLSPAAMLLLGSMLNACESGVLHDYQSCEREYIKLFSGISEYYSAFGELSQSKFVLQSNENVFIKPIYSTYFYEILGYIESKKRWCRKSPERIKNDYDAFINKYGTRLDEIIPLDPDKLLRYNTKTKGVKIPESFKMYFTGEQIKSSEADVMFRMDNNAFDQEFQRRNLTKEEIRMYYACMKFADTNGIIENFDIQSLITSILIEFGDGSVCQSTVYCAINKLFEVGLIFADGSQLIIAGYKSAFDRKERDVIIPDVVLEKAFKKCTTASIKVFFRILFMLNNGDGGKGANTGANKTVWLSLGKLLPWRAERDSENDNWLKKRYPGEICQLFWGDIDGSDINSLSLFFHINSKGSGDNIRYFFRIRKEFYISKSADLFKMAITLTGKNKKRAQVIEDAFKSHGLVCNQADLVDLVKIFRGAGSKNIRFVIGQLAERILSGKAQGWDDIKSIPAYVYAVFKGKQERPVDSYVNPHPEPT